MSVADSHAQPPADGAAGARVGRPRSTDRARITHAALELFAERGFERTTVDEIAVAVGITRRTLFRYYPSKNDIVWGDFDVELEAFADVLRALPDALPIVEVVRRGVLAFNDWGEEGLADLRGRMELITTVPALQAHAALRYADWSDVVARFVAERTGDRVDGLAPQAVAAMALGSTMTAYRRWVVHGGDVLALIDGALRLAAAGFSDEGLRGAAGGDDATGAGAASAPGAPPRAPGAARPAA